ncbi:hypothetical protein AHMF7605_24735 [Adhaeribacter arboris]|uniref:Uncharacterized protein n=1 Tax=Adhaeribacter arboris TaxID=2072846 RepID=A0A2T2YLT3_9BACT|nr:hypothetical protein AHMF7605_24735 [Adhaeribacter arboris]
MLLLFLAVVLILLNNIEDGRGKESFKAYFVILAMFMIYGLVNFLTLGLIEKTKYKGNKA